LGWETQREGSPARETLRGRANYYNASGLAVKCHRFCAPCNILLHGRSRFASLKSL